MHIWDKESVSSNSLSPIGAFILDRKCYLKVDITEFFIQFLRQFLPLYGGSRPGCLQGTLTLDPLHGLGGLKDDIHR